MKTLALKITIITLCVSLTGFAQKNHERTYNEEFITNSDVVIDVDSRYTDVIIETWNKNKVEVKATILIEGVTNKQAESTLENWKFKALGNKSSVEISSRNSNLLIGRNNNLDYKIGHELPMALEELPLILENGSDILNLSTMHLENLAPLISESIIIALDSLSLPKIESFNFDYEKFQNDQNYLSEWQKNFEKNKLFDEKELKKFAAKAQKMAESFEFERSHAKRLEELKEHVAERTKERELRSKELKRALEKRQEAQDKRREEVKERLLTRKDGQNRIIINGHPVSSNKNYAIAQALESRDKMKVKRTITIKAPKGAKFNMNVKYGSISFPN